MDSDFTLKRTKTTKKQNIKKLQKGGQSFFGEDGEC